MKSSLLLRADVNIDFSRNLRKSPPPQKRTYKHTFARSWSISRTSHWSIIDIPERINWELSGYISSINPKIIKKNIKDYWHFFICFYMQLKVSLEYYVSWEFANKTLASDNSNETSLHAPSKMMVIFNKFWIVLFIFSAWVI